MASFAGVFQAFYFSTGAKGPAVAAISATITDGLGDQTFMISEPLTVFRADGSEWFSGVFSGSTNIAGTTLVVVKNAVGDLVLFGGSTQLSSSLFPELASGLALNETTFTVCFLGGTAIATPAGTRAVETLAVGDRVLTADGRVAPVRWIGVQTVVTVFADPLRSLPIRIEAGALDDGLPHRDLFVSPDHALFLDGVLVQAAALVNGTSIVRITDMPDRFTYFHVELDDHALILAEGVPAETFLDTVTRRRFDNFAEFEALYGDTGASIAELNLPRVKSARQFPAALRNRLSRSAIQTDAA